MLGLSTSYISALSQTGQNLLESLVQTGISAIELDYRITEGVFEQMKRRLETSNLKVLSIHNFFPLPSDKPKVKGSGDFFMLSSPEEEERQRAVQGTKKTIAHAAEQGAEAVVLHCGRVEIERELDVLYQFYRSDRIDSKEAQAYIRQKMNEVEMRKPKFFDSLLSSLDSLLPSAEEFGIMLGLENRYHYDELPMLGDFDSIFSRFEGAPLGYWHDVGHAHALECMTIVPPGAHLNRYAKHLIGVHLHDAIGIDDHLVPGSGEIDLNQTKLHLKTDTLKIIELKKGTPQDEVKQAICFISETLASPMNA
jgi:sugar phosphate isomerase/epimerase